MNNRKAKQIRKLVYKGEDYRVREYGILKSGRQVVNIGQLVEIGDRKHSKKIAKRRIYRHCKRVMINTKIKDLIKEILI